MSRPNTIITAAAGEHYVAYQLSSRGYLVAMTRGGAPTVDLMVTGTSGKKTVLIQVKTSRSANQGEYFRWHVGPHAVGLSEENLFYAFVDLKRNGGNDETPDVYIVASKDVSSVVKAEYTVKMFGICQQDREKALNSWTVIEKVLGSPLTSPAEPLDEVTT